MFLFYDPQLYLLLHWNGMREKERKRDINEVMEEIT